jgi:glycerol uptake facilitator-like aquaporin
VRLRQRVAAEFVGSAFLVAAVIGSGIAASRLSPHDVGLQLLQNSIVTGAVLVALILALHPVSASFNPVITVLERVVGRIRSRVAVALVGAQLAGAATGAVIANLMFDLPPVSLSAHVRSGTGLWLGELVATLGLVVIVFGTLRGTDSSRVAYAVGGYITGAYWFTSSTSFANPAVTLARTLTDTFAGIAPTSVPPFILAQLLGGAAGLGIIALLHPQRHDTEAITPWKGPPS